MPQLEITIDQIIQLIQELPSEEKRILLERLNHELISPQTELDAETQLWLEEDLVEELPAYEWGEAGIPTGKAVQYIPGTGFVIEGGREIV